MKSFVPYEKLSKKARRALDAEKRRTWGFSPVTRSPGKPGAYDRNKTRRMDFDDPPDVSFFGERGVRGFLKKAWQRLLYTGAASGGCLSVSERKIPRPG